MSNKTRRWVRGLIETVIHGGASAVVSVLTASALDKQDWGIASNPGNFFKLLGATFVVNGTLRLAQFLNNNPLPPGGDSTPPFQTQPVISLNPLSKVQPIPKDPPTEPTKGN